MSDDLSVQVNPAPRFTVTVRPPAGSWGSLVQVSSRAVAITQSGPSRVGVVATAKGPQGERGPQGATGPGVPAGGEAGLVLAKRSAADHDSEWRQIVYFGTGEPPDPAGIAEGALYFQVEE